MEQKPTPGQGFRKTESQGARAVEATSVMGDLTPEIIAEIQEQKRTGDYRKIGGRPWWTSVYSLDELKNAKLI